MLNRDKITEIFCIADDFCKEFDLEIKKHRIEAYDGKRRRNRTCTMSDSEIITILLCFHFGSFRNFKHYYLHYVGEHLKSDISRTVIIQPVYPYGTPRNDSIADVSKTDMLGRMYRDNFCRFHQNISLQY